jgi:hypothetical protein
MVFDRPEVIAPGYPYGRLRQRLRFAALTPGSVMTDRAK